MKFDFWGDLISSTFIFWAASNTLRALLKSTYLIHLEAFSLPSALHEALIVCLGAPFVASKAEADIATGEAFRAVLWCALAALGGAIAVAKLAFEGNAPIHRTHLGDHDLGKELSQIQKHLWPNL